MKWNTRILRWIPALAIAVAFVACDAVSGPGGLVGPQVGAPSQSLLGGEDDVTKFTVVKEKDLSVGVVSGIIGSGGGKLVLGKHELWVPRDAVSSSTTFTMSKAGDEVRFKLTATRLLPNDVGHAGFAVPVKLVVSFQDATNVSDPSLLKIFWAKLDGTFEEQPTQVDIIGKKAAGTLGHFSDYIMAIP